MEITKREALASVSIVAVMLLIGFLISGKIQNSIMDDNEQYNKAVKIENEELFQYGMDTNVGDAFVYGDLEAVDTVTYPEIGGEYIFCLLYTSTAEHLNTVKKWLNICKGFLVNNLGNSKGTDANKIFIAKAAYGMAETKAVEQEQITGARKTVEQIAQDIGANELPNTGAQDDEADVFDF